MKRCGSGSSTGETTRASGQPPSGGVVSTVHHHGRETAYETSPGTGVGLCCVHGSGGTRAVWKALRARADRPVTALDLAGHGASADVETAAGAETLEAYVEDVAAVHRAADARVLVGNSLGGVVALQTVLSGPAALDVEALVLVGSGARLAVAGSLRGLLATDFERTVEVLHGPDRLFHDPPERLREVSVTGMHAVGSAVTERDFLTCHRTDLRDRLDAVDVPVLALTGVHDELTPPRLSAAVAAGVPDGRAALVPAAAHLSMLERPGRVRALLGWFLDTVGV